MIRQLQRLIESSIIRGYRSVAREMGLLSSFWEKTEIVGSPSDVERLTVLMQKLQAIGPHYAHLFETNVKTVLGIKGASSNTFPVTQIAVIDSTLIEGESEAELVRRLVYVACYIQFYQRRFVFLPQLLQKTTDAKARSSAAGIALDAANKFSEARTA